MPKPVRSALPSPQFWGLATTLLGLFLMGGSTRGDVQSLAILAPAVIICCGAALLTFKQKHWQDKRGLAWAVGLVYFLVALYLVPLPLTLETFSRGQNDAHIRAAANLSSEPHILAMAPYAAWQSFFSLFAPLAVILFALQLNRDDLRLTVSAVISLGVISGLVGILQLVSSGDGLYFYHITNGSSAVGLFANRNHAAVFLACLFPMLALYSTGAHRARSGDRKKISRIIAIALAMILLPLILVTGSRSGILSALCGMLGGGLLFVSGARRDGDSKMAISLGPVLAVSVIVSLVFVALHLSRAEAIDRIFDKSDAINDRAVFWASSLALFSHYFPFGFGPGAFVPVYQSQEPLALLDASYLNRLHNDWLETVLTFGVPTILLGLGGAIQYIRRSFVLWMRMDGKRGAVALGRMASIILAILAIASVSDYPLRAPGMAGFAALVLVWFLHAQSEPHSA